MTFLIKFKDLQHFFNALRLTSNQYFKFNKFIPSGFNPDIQIWDPEIKDYV